MLPQSPLVPFPSATISNKRLLTRMTTATTTAAAASVKLFQLTQTRRHTHAWTRTDVYTLCGHLLPFLKGLEPDRAPRGQRRRGRGRRRVGLCVFFGVFKEKRKRGRERKRRKAMPSHRHKPDTPCPAPSRGASSGAGQ